ncbi:hypothetical protein SAMN04489724_0662 [Algoriphagus locisalis]|uniref:Glycosyltransferase family 29 (Sialyltransferase) n=1 Tax=Algoriphagus locisalis TaxID=305507 RepID=A0A1I6XUH6_9BACT|nr:hypothetical protein [Algoriphagus locisalis]SFT41682.1 hypothetical protein SAMN04489724_0662 [Algoriphagus locisalis]
MKFIKALIGLIYFIFFSKRIDLDKLFKGKNIAIIGSADTVFECENGSYIDSFDIVIRINRSYCFLSEDNQKFLGSKTSILFWNFFERDNTNFGYFNLQKFNKANIDFLILGRSNLLGIRQIFNFYKKYTYSINTYYSSFSSYKKLCEKFDIKPTIGFVSLYNVLNSDFKSCFISGFSFYETKYLNDYEKAMNDKTSIDLFNFVKVERGHRPDIEFKVFKEMIIRHSNRSNIFLDNFLKNSISQNG